MDKPAGPTSHDIVQRVRRAYRTRAVGHTGTLDPFATGLLVVLVGRATRLARFVEAAAKTYLATARLGVRTTTDDLTGEVIETADASAVPEWAVADALASFVGVQRQRPPAFSAKRVAGERSYDRARRGEAVILAEVPVTVHALELVAYRAPELVFRATVSAGTYIRALARDLGARLGVGAHLTALRRERIGALRVEDAIAADQLDGSVPLLPPLAVLGDMPRVSLDDEARRAVRHGRALPAPAALPGGAAEGLVALAHGGELVAVATARDGRLRPTVVLEGPET